MTRDYALASSAQAVLCKPAGGPAQWVCVLTEVQVGGGGVGEIKERWAGQSARPRQCSRQCVLRCMNCACALHWAHRVDSCGAVILHPGALEPGQGSGALVVWLRTGEPVVPDSQCHTAATTLLVSPTDWLTDCGPLLGLGCSRSAAALVSRKWEQVVGAACSVVSGGVVTSEVEANFASLARHSHPCKRWSLCL